MPRPLKFDKDQVLTKALYLFWEKGYTAASVSHLLHAMNLNRGSMYATFGDKRSLYTQALELYDHLIMDKIIAFLTDNDDPLKGIHDFFDAYFLNLTKDQLRLGCFIVNTIVEMSDIDNELAALASNKSMRHENALKEALIRANEMGQLGKGKDPVALSRFLSSTIKGLRVTLKETQDENVIKDIINTALKVFD